MNERPKQIATQNCDQTQVNVSVIAKDFYTMEEAAAILHVNCSTLHKMTHLKDDPFPARLLYWKKQGLLVNKDEMNAWVLRNAPFRDDVLEFRRKKSRGEK